MEIAWQQLPALLGVAVGVLATYLVAGAGERGRWRRSQQAEWTVRRMEAYRADADARWETGQPLCIRLCCAQ